ncbi:MAG: homoserine dehydrogenase [Elusimicrobia bacterium]|nr:homoserine dehydrogenase [Elusimicrobiota bacterium]
MIKIGIVGLGHVGLATLKLLNENRNTFRQRLGDTLEVRWLCDRHPEKKIRGISIQGKPRITRHYQDLLKDSELDVVVELMGGLEPARSLVLGALRSRKHVVTANKQLLSHHWEEIFDTASRHQRRVLMEASVAGGIPILQAFQESLSANRISRVLGILNGTTNHILTQMSLQRCELLTALKQAQQLGLAERNPTLDLQGADAAHKLSIIASLLTGSWISSSRIYQEGIEHITLEDVLYSERRLGRHIKLLALLELKPKGTVLQVEARVHPVLLPQNHPLASVQGAYNAILVQASAAKDLMFYGLGAGAEPAASAVVGDLFTLSKEILGGLSENPLQTLRSNHTQILPIQDIVSEFYIRLSVKDRPGVLSQITGILGRRGISIARIDQRPQKKSRSASIILLTHPTQEKRMDQVVREIKKLSVLLSPFKPIRLL